MAKQFLCIRHHEHGIERAIDVSGRSEREIERIERGMLMNLDVEGGWFTDDLTADELQAAGGVNKEA